MKLSVILILLFSVAISVIDAHSSDTSSSDTSSESYSIGWLERYRKFQARKKKFHGKKYREKNVERTDTNCSCENVQDKLKDLAKQIQMIQFYIEEAARADGHSGMKVMRLRGEGTRLYHATSHSDDYTMGSTHDHPDFFNTCGMGEIVAVLNGIEFKTRHNDYLLVKKSMTSKTFGETEEIPYPDVPPSVLGCDTLEDQIAEMREYFRAWKEQDESIRDYKPYFKANLCYMEGAWTISDPDDIQEAFFSERHFYEAFSWNDLYQKTRFSSYTGTKENLENYAFMPTTLWEIKDNGECVYGQWNYQILCHPLPDDLPLNRLRVINDLKTRMSSLLTMEELLQSRNARFQVNPYDKDEFIEGSSKHGFFDTLMEQIPGMDNYGAVLNGDSLGNTIQPFDATDDDDSLNAANYHRWFQNDDNGAMGIKYRHRGFNDEHMWVAMNTQKNILPIRVDVCEYVDNVTVCQSWEQRWSYAMPMEIIYTTPLNSWNPHHIVYKGLDRSDHGQTIFQGPGGTKRDGTNDPHKAFNGTNSAKFYMTPVDFFEGNEIGDDPADTPKDSVFVLNKHGCPFEVRGSGIRTFLPEIPGLGSLRQRYPIHTIYGEGNPVWKELAALKDIVLNSDLYGFMLNDEVSGNVLKPLKLTLQAGSAGHKHDMIIPAPKVATLNNGGSVTVITEMRNGHAHTLEVEYDAVNDVYIYTSCTGLPKCKDGHPRELTLFSPN